MSSDELEVGADITPGQVIDAVGKLDDSHASMLHLELYTGTSTCALTVRSNGPYERRADLFDPTTWLVAASV